MTDDDIPLYKWGESVPPSPKKGLFFSVGRWAEVLPMASVGLEMDDLPYATQDSKEWDKKSRVALFPLLSVPEEVEGQDGYLAVELDSGRKGWISSRHLQAGRLLIDPEDTLFVAHMKGILDHKGWKPFYVDEEGLKRLGKEIPPDFNEHLLPYDPVSPVFWFGESCQTCGAPYDVGGTYESCHSCDEPRTYSPNLNLGPDYE